MVEVYTSLCRILELRFRRYVVQTRLFFVELYVITKYY